MTHEIPNALKAIKPWLKSKVKSSEFWNKEYNTLHQGETNIEPMNEEEKKEFIERFNSYPDPLNQIKDKVINIIV